LKEEKKKMKKEEVEHLGNSILGKDLTSRVSNDLISVFSKSDLKSYLDDFVIFILKYDNLKGDLIF
jgi:hypothetical protein